MATIRDIKKDIYNFSKYMKVLVLIIGLVSLFFYLIGNHLTKPHPKEIGSIPNDLKNTREVSFPSKSGSQLSGWFLEAKQGKGGVLLLHGVKSNRLQMLNRAKFLQKAGYDVLLFDFQAHGESRGEQITFGYLESLDAKSAFDYLQDRLCNPSVGVIGVSLGGASALLGDVKLKAKVLILEGVYPTIEEAIENRLKIYLGSVGTYFTSLLTLQLKPRLEIGVDDLKPIEELKYVKGAVMIIAGANDKRTTLKESKKMFAEAKEPKELWIVEGAGHVDFDKVNKDKYKKKVLDFLEKYM